MVKSKMSTGGKEKVGYSLVNDKTLKLEYTNNFVDYNSIVICQDKIFVLDNIDNKVKIRRLHDGKFLGKLDSDPRPGAICLMDATTICVLHLDGLVEMVSIKSEDMSPVFTRMKSFRLHGVFEIYKSVVRVNDNIVVVGVKQGTTYWCIVSLDDGHVDTIHQICKGSGWSSVTTKDNIIYISCLAGVVDDDTGVYGFDILNPSQCKYKYKQQRLRNPRSIVINEDGNIFVCNFGLFDYSCIHQLTASCQLVAIFTQGIPWGLQAMFWDNGRLYVTCRWSRDITVFQHVYQEGSHKYSEFPMSHEKKQPIIVETSKEIEQGNVDKGQSSEEMETQPSIQIHVDYRDDKQDTLTEDRICHLLSSESDLKVYISHNPPEAYIKTLLSQASKLSGKKSMKIILRFIVQQFTERFSEKHIWIWAGEEVIGPENVQTVLVCFYSGSLDTSMQSFYGLKVIYREYNKSDPESAEARAHERNIKSDLTPEHRDLINKAITFHGEGLFTKHSNLEAISSSGILSSKSRGLVPEPCVILYCRVKGIIPFDETPFPKRLKVNEDASIAVDVREGYFSSCADSQNNDQRNTFHHESQQQMEPLKMGCSVGPARSPQSGTMGPFVQINSDRIGFLTCAHVVFCDSELIDLANITQTGQIEKEIVQPPDDDSPASQNQNNHRVCGRVLNAMFRGDWSPLPSEKFGIDAAVIEIISRSPSPGAFVPIEQSQLNKSGFSLEQPPMFNTGKMMPYPIDLGIEKTVIKIGSVSGLTQGTLQLTSGMVRYSTRRVTRKNGNDSTEGLTRIMHGLMEISSAEFCKLGDSGAGVFLVDADDFNTLICIGLLLGFLSDGLGLIMPIDKVLTALHRGDSLQIKLKDFENEAFVKI